MPDFILMAKGFFAAAIAAGLLRVAIARPGKNPSRWKLATAWVLGLGAGLGTGYGALGEWPRWPPLEDRDRLLFVLLPLTLAAEFAAALFSNSWVRWILRLIVAAVAAPILLYNSVYLADLSGPKSAEWSREEAVLILSALAGLLAGVWALLARLEASTSPRAMSPVMILVMLAAAVTVMLSGYLRGGMLALPLAGALTGTAVASYAVPSSPDVRPGLGLGIVGLFAVLILGRFFGSLPTGLGLGLFVSPLLAWIVEIPFLRKFPPSAREAIRIAMVVLALAFLVTLARLRFQAALGAGRFVPHHSISLQPEKNSSKIRSQNFPCPYRA
jgi:hypothetical protein